MSRQTLVIWGSESYYALLAAGWTEAAPFAEGDASNPLRVMSPSGYAPPKPAKPRRCFREMARSERPRRKA